MKWMKSVGPRREHIVSLSFLEDDIALVDVTYGISPEPLGHAFYLMIKRQGRWAIRSARITPNVPAPSAPVP